MEMVNTFTISDKAPPSTVDLFSIKKNNPTPHLPRLHKSLRHFTVTSSVAGGDEVGHAAALQEGGGGDRPGRAENTSKSDHLHQPQSDHRCLGVVPETQAVTETCPHGNDVLRSRRRAVKTLRYSDLD